jgi:hypothetical protein
LSGLITNADVEAEKRHLGLDEDVEETKSAVLEEGAGSETCSVTAIARAGVAATRISVVRAPRREAI